MLSKKMFSKVCIVCYSLSKKYEKNINIHEWGDRLVVDYGHRYGEHGRGNSVSINIMAM